MTPNFEFRYISVDALLPNPLRPRFRIDREKLLKLAESIRQYGLFQPILVGKTSAGLQVIAGERRWKAAKLAGVSDLPAMVIEASSVDLILYFLEENFQREQVNLLEQAAAISRLLVKDGFTVEAIAKRLKVDEDEIQELLSTNDLPEKVKDAYFEGKITNKELKEIAKEDDPLTAIHKAKSR